MGQMPLTVSEEREPDRLPFYFLLVAAPSAFVPLGEDQGEGTHNPPALSDRRFE